MKLTRFVLFIVLLSFAAPLVALAQAETPAATHPVPDRLRQAIGLSLPYLEAAGVEWIEEKKCASCHRVTFLTWSLNAAAREGFSIEKDKLHEWLDWTVRTSREPAKEGDSPAGESNIDGLSQLILGHPQDSAEPLDAEAKRHFVELILKTQKGDGSWKPAGQLPSQKRPERETAQVSTMWNVLALHKAGSTPNRDEAVRLARSSLADAKPGVSTEWYAVRLLLSQVDEDPQARKAALESLLSLQQADGGWGWLTSEPSDALATGQALYALALAGAPAADPHIQRAQEFLVSTQTENGSWPVRSTKEKKKSRIEETATYWGTAWATLGLLHTLPPAP